MSVCSSGANRRNHQIKKYGCLSQARNKYGRVGQQLRFIWRNAIASHI
jgi:hypothetical protein